MKSDATEAVRLIEGVAWAEEAARREPEEAGTKARSFKLIYPQGAVEVFRYAAPSTPFGRLAAALDALVQAEKPVPPEPREPRSFPDVADSGVVTMQTIALVGPERAVTVRVAADGTWTRPAQRPAPASSTPSSFLL